VFVLAVKPMSDCLLSVIVVDERLSLNLIILDKYSSLGVCSIKIMSGLKKNWMISSE